MAGAHMVQEAAPAHPRPSHVVVKMPEDHGIPGANLGTGHRGASRLLLDAAERKKLVRLVDVVLLRTWTSAGTLASGPQMASRRQGKAQERNRRH